MKTEQECFTTISEEKPQLSPSSFFHHQLLSASAQTAALMAAANNLSVHATIHHSLFNVWNPLTLSPPPPTPPTQKWPQLKTPPESPQNEVSSSSSTDSIRSEPKRTRSEYDSSSPEGGNTKPFVCAVCSRGFGYKHVLQNHERTHTGEKPFECKECHKRFTRDHHLKTHMRLHTGERPYHCMHCDRQFVQVANLRRHLRVHTGEKPYTCGECGGRFSDSNQLKAHVLVHKGEAAKLRRKPIKTEPKIEAEDLRVVQQPNIYEPVPEQTEPQDLSMKSNSD